MPETKPSRPIETRALCITLVMLGGIVLEQYTGNSSFKTYAEAVIGIDSLVRIGQLTITDSSSHKKYIPYNIALFFAHEILRITTGLNN